MRHHHDPDAAEPGEDVGLADAFWVVARDLRRLSMSTSEPWEVSPSQSRALRVLGRHGPIRLNELSDQLHIAPRSATEVVDALEERGLARRSPDPHDRRAVLVDTTDEGTRVLGALREARTAQAEAYFGRLSVADQKSLARILTKLRAQR
ncbi:MarR family winged helix-turn-helix transcriptional regulator [uncultured Jatrophihabitans sp.]|uniref:MarR family winged helix-turn-helix transcriptional regulator n=1 Tax=uncultured Jatrophihabitans sp. TaxID=1610747 RepID=UPI0035CCA1A2